MQFDIDLDCYELIARMQRRETCLMCILEDPLTKMAKSIQFLLNTKEEIKYFKFVVSIYALPWLLWVSGFIGSNEYLSSLSLGLMLWLSIITIAIVSWQMSCVILHLLKYKNVRLPVAWQTLVVQFIMVSFFYLMFYKHGNAARAFWIYSKGMSVIAIVLFSLSRIFLR